MAIPATDKITATFPKKHVSASFPNGDRFAASLRTIETGVQAGRIWNQEFIAAKHWVANGCEHAQHVSAHDARGRRRDTPYYDCRDNIGYAFCMNQAAKMSRNLKKLQKRSPDAITPGIAEYIETLDQIDAVWKWLQSVKPIIVKGRKPAENPKPVDLTNTGHCAVCERLWKLDGARRQAFRRPPRLQDQRRHGVLFRIPRGEVLWHRVPAL
jgi:hypothetical protein